MKLSYYLLIITALLTLTLPLSALIVGGEEAPDADFPWITAVYFEDHLCGGTLIHPKWVLTAAHCIIDDDYVYHADEIAVAVGFNNRQNVNKFIYVSKVIVHPDFKGGSADFANGDVHDDIALLELKEAVQTPPITLNQSSSCPKNGSDLTLAGWGSLEEDGSVVSMLHRVDLPLVSNEECETALRKSNYFKNVPILSTMMCAGNGLGDSDACHGDSGGPLFVKNGNSYVQYGLVSFGNGCAKEGFYGVYTRVSEYIDWINSKTGDSIAINENEECGAEFSDNDDDIYIDDNSYVDEDISMEYSTEVSDEEYQSKDETQTDSSSKDESEQIDYDNHSYDSPGTDSMDSLPENSVSTPDSDSYKPETEASNKSEKDESGCGCSVIL